MPDVNFFKELGSFGIVAFLAVVTVYRLVPSFLKALKDQQERFEKILVEQRGDFGKMLDRQNEKLERVSRRLEAIEHRVEDMEPRAYVEGEGSK